MAPFAYEELAMPIGSCTSFWGGGGVATSDGTWAPLYNHVSQVRKRTLSSQTQTWYSSDNTGIKI